MAVMLLGLGGQVVLPRAAVLCVGGNGDVHLEPNHAVCDGAEENHAVAGLSNAQSDCEDIQFVAQTARLEPGGGERVGLALCGWIHAAAIMPTELGNGTVIGLRGTSPRWVRLTDPVLCLRSVILLV